MSRSDEDSAIRRETLEFRHSLKGGQGKEGEKRREKKKGEEILGLRVWDKTYYGME